MQKYRLHDMDIQKYSSKRWDLRLDLCAMVAGHVAWIEGTARTAEDNAFLVKMVCQDVAHYREAVIALDAEIEKEQVQA